MFDLDGTLLTAGGIGQRSSQRALEKVFGTAGDLDKFYPGGRTQEAIFMDTLLNAGFNQSAYLEKRDQLYSVFLKYFLEGIRTGEHQIGPLPGAIEVLEIFSRDPDLLIGIVTGNQVDISALKLQEAGFCPDWFKVGAYGQESSHRPDLIPMAQQRAEALTGNTFPGELTVVVGDTTRDVLSAKSAAAVSIALTTGTDPLELLKSVGPDYVLDNIKGVLEIIG